MLSESKPENTFFDLVDNDRNDYVRRQLGWCVLGLSGSTVPRETMLALRTAMTLWGGLIGRAQRFI